MPQPTGTGPADGSRFRPTNALAVYGTLAPGEVNHHVVADIEGRWVDGSVRGHRFTTRWSGLDGYPGFRPDSDGPVIPVKVLLCDHWHRYWDRLDNFEGPGYSRVEIEVLDRGGSTPIGTAFVYECLAAG